MLAGFVFMILLFVLKERFKRRIFSFVKFANLVSLFNNQSQRARLRAKPCLMIRKIFTHKCGTTKLKRPGVIKQQRKCELFCIEGGQRDAQPLTEPQWPPYQEGLLGSFVFNNFMVETAKTSVWTAGPTHQKSS